MLEVWVEITVNRETSPMEVTMKGQQIVKGIGHTGTDEGYYPIDDDLPTDFDTDLDSWFPENAPA